jgi:hypothetical protein
MIYLERSWVHHGDCPGTESAITSLTPIASFSTAKKLEDFFDQLKEHTGCRYVPIKTVGDARLPHDPKRLSPKMKEKIDNHKP